MTEIDLNNKILNKKMILNQDDEIQFENETDMSLKIRLESIEAENKTIKQQLSDFHESYEEMLRLKNKEINAMNHRVKDLENKYEIIKNKNKTTEDINSNLTLENNTLKKENDSLKYDRDILTKSIEELTEQEKNFQMEKKKLNEMGGEYKIKLAELNLEKQKYLMKCDLYEKKIKELEIDYSNNLKEKMNNLEIIGTENKNKYEEIIEKKDEEINKIKVELMKMKLDKDKFESDSKTYNELHEDAINNFNTNINKYIAEYEKIKNDLIRVEKSKDLQIQNLEKLNKQLTEENFEIKQEMQILKNTVKNKKKIFEENEQNL